MKKFISVLKEVNGTISRILLADRFVDTVLIFLASFLVLFFIKFYPGMVIVPALVYLGISFHTEIRRRKWKMVEDKYSPLNEKLRTAADNVNMENPVVERLQEEVVADLRNVRSSWFMDVKKTSYKILGIVALCFLILLSAHFDVHWNPVEAFQGPLREFRFGPGGSGIGDLDSDIIGAGEQSDADIFGKGSVAKLGKDEIKIQINPGGNEINLRDVTEVEDREFEESFPDEVYAGSSDLYEENLPKDQLNLVKAYFENLAKSGT